MNKKENDAANNLYTSLRDNPKEIIEWCEREIKEYKKLIKLIKNKKKEKDE